MSAHLVSVSDSMLGRRFSLDGSAVIGRGVECDVSLVDAGVSRRHARLHENERGWIIEDLSSRNGVWVNGSRISSPVTLVSNDCVSVGPFLLLFEPDFSVLASDVGQGAAIIAADSKTLTSHRPERFAPADSPDSPDSADRNGLNHALLAALTDALTKSDAESFWERFFAPIAERYAPDACGVLSVSSARSGAPPEAVFISPPGGQLVIPRGILDACVTSASSGALSVAGGVASPIATLRGDDASSAATLTIPVESEGKLVALVQLARYTTRGWSSKDAQPLLRSAPVFAAALAAAAQLEAARKKTSARPAETDATAALILGDSRAMTEVRRFIEKTAPFPSSVLIVGETGTGKELIARSLHQESKSNQGPFVAINCGAVPEHLIESEFFGHERGAFSGAQKRKYGLLEAANGGTLFLDEIGELPTHLQVKLLRALQEREFYRLGGSKIVRSEFRLLAATHRELPEHVRDGSFREDLFYRINVLTIEAPPLRKREGDVELLFEAFVNEYCRELGKAPLKIGRSALKALRDYRWPGNVRELRNVAERLVVLAESDEISAADLPAELRGPNPSRPHALADRVAELERRHIADALGQAGYAKSAAARSLGISRPTLDKKIRDYQIPLYQDQISVRAEQED